MRNLWDFESTSTVSGVSIEYSTSDGPEYTPQERAAIITHKIDRGAALTTAEIAAYTGITVCGAWRMMDRISRVVPIVQDEGRWRRFNS
jgi:hypothetical protein